MIAADTHVHLYPSYDLSLVFKSAAEFLPLPGVFEGVKPFRILFAADRAGFPSARQLLARKEMWRSGPMPQIEEDGDASVVNFPSGDRFVVAPGRQIISAEKLEVLALASTTDVPEGTPASEIVESVLNNGGVPVLPWSPGKWWFERGKTVLELLERTDPQQLLLGDVFMRPSMWPTPSLLQKGLETGHKIIAGSDPLNGSGEEQFIGRYGILGEMRDNGAHPEDAMDVSRRFLREGRYRKVGVRATLETFARRMMLARRAPHPAAVVEPSA